MKQKITDYLKDMENHWVAKLSCGHVQHVRHDPPWMEREWVTTEEGRQSRVGTELNCVVCDELAKNLAEKMAPEIKKTFIAAYESAGVSGLCDEGRLETAVGSVDSAKLASMISSSL